MLLVSADQSHSLGDVLGVPVHTGQIVRVPISVSHADPDAPPAELSGRLDVLALDTLALLAAQWSGVGDTLSRILPASDLTSIAAEELAGLPGIQELLGLHAISEFAACGRWDRIIVDSASTADAVRMLTLPGTFGLYVERAWPRHRRLAAMADDPRSAALADLVERAGSGLERLSLELGDPERVSAHLVLTPEKVVAAETIRTLAALSLAGIAVEEVIVNQVLIQDESYEYQNLPDHPAFTWYSERIVEQRSVLDELDSAIGDVVLVIAPQTAGEPIGPDSLVELLDNARRRSGAPLAGPLASTVDLQSGTGLESVYRLRLSLPHVDPETLTLGRSADDLVIGAGGVRRRVRLASVLRRCTVIDARLRGGELTILFRPDPRVWPS